MSEQLINILTERKTGNIESIEVLEERRPGIQTNINLFSPICNAVDSQIVSIASSILTIQNEIVGLSTNAYAVGCGTTGVGAIVIYPDTVKNYSYNISTQSYDGDSPYDVNVSLLNSGNVGFGTFLVYTQNDSSQSGIGTLYDDIGVCYRIPCTSGNCVSFASSITEKQNQLTVLRNQLTELVTSSNSVKTERVNYEIERYAGNYTIRILTEENVRISTAITTIKKYS
jgi:hypothetical protein